MDATFDYFLQTYGAACCALAFNTGDAGLLPHREAKQRVNPFVSDYISSLGLTTESTWDAEDTGSRKPPAKPTRKRAKVIFGTGDSNAWTTPLHDVAPAPRLQAASPSTNSTLTTNYSTTQGNDNEVTVENFAEKLSFMRSDFTKQFEESSAERKRQVEASEERVASVKTELEKSMTEFRGYVTSVFTRQDECMGEIKNEVKSIDASLKQQTACFTTEIADVRGQLTEVLTAVSNLSNQFQPQVPSVMQTGQVPVTPNVPSPLSFRTDSFLGKSPQQRAQEIRQAEAAHAQTLLAEQLGHAQQVRNQTAMYNGRTTTPTGGSGNHE